MIKVFAYNSNIYYNGQNLKKNSDTINLALEEIKKVNFSENDINYVKKIGAKPPFKNGKEAYDFIKKSNIKVKFAPMPSNDTHAQWDIDENTIKINEIYKNNKNKAVILAISEAIIHEAGHAKDNDGESSIQEELNCLSLNAMAHRDYNRKYPDIYNSNTQESIVKNGVTLYSEAYFETNPYKLIKKVQKSYSHLPTGDVLHPASYLAYTIKYNHF